MTPKTSATMFRSARKSGNAALFAFATALFAALALHVGAFLPRLTSPAAVAEPAMASTPAAAEVAPVLAGAAPAAAPRG